MTDLAVLTRANAARWQNAKLTRGPEFTPVAKRLVAPAAKARYQAIEAATGVPWFIIAVIHQRESSQDWTTQLAQGDPLNKVSRNDPAGRGPFLNHPDDPPGQDAFYRGALDALIDCGPYAAKWKDWSPGGAMTLLEQYNGLGYANMGVPSAYIWSGTDQYKSGKYIRDHVYDPSVVDSQLGCAGLLMAMMAIDPTITFGAQIPAAQAPAAGVQPSIPPKPDWMSPSPTPSGPPDPPIPNPFSWVNFIADIFTAVFKRK